MHSRRLALAALLFGVAQFQIPGQVSFTLSSSPGVGNNPRAVIAADVNGDGNLDLISANQNQINANSLSVLTNTGGGGFATSATLAAGSQPYSVAAADVNGDGHPDLVCANYNGNTITVYTNNGSGIFVTLITVPAGTRPKCVISTDVNHDGRPDIITANSSSSTLSVLLNQGSGYYFTAVDSSPATGAGPACVTAGDVNADGRLDLIVANLGDTVRGFTILTNDGTGHFSAALAPNNFIHSSWVTAADVNADNAVDLIVVGASSSANAVSVYTNNQAGSFSLASTAATGTTPFAATAADLNGDGSLDLATANQGNNTLSILTNNGTGIFSLALSPTVGSGPESLVAADVNGDGKPDLVSGNWNVATLSVMINNTPFPPPRLTIEKSGPETLVRWPSSATGWRLLQAAELSLDWLPCTGIADDGTNRSFAVSPGTGSGFFRLVTP